MHPGHDYRRRGFLPQEYDPSIASTAPPATGNFMADTNQFAGLRSRGMEPPPGPGSLGQGGGGFSLGDLWGGMKDIGSWAGGNAGTMFDFMKTGYDIYNKEAFIKPMLEKQQQRAAELWATQKPMMEYNLASRIDEGRKREAQGLEYWNSQRPQDVAARTYEQGMNRTAKPSYV